MTVKVEVPALGESITEAVIGNWLKAEGEAVALDEPIAELETDKVAVEVNAPTAGILKKILVKKGAKVAVGANIAEIEEGAAATPMKKEEKAAASAPKLEKADNKKALTPLARRLAEEKGLDVSALTGSGPAGRIGKDDIMRALETKAPKREMPAGAREERMPMSPLRKRIAERLKEAQDTAAILTTFNEVDMAAVMEARSRNKEAFEKKHGVKLGFMSFFVKACVHALREIPSVNASIDGEDIVYKNHYDIGVAVSTPKGLVVPVVRDADVLSFADIEKIIADLGLRAREGKLKLDELQGGTFSISNGGVFGSLLSTPILNPPQSAILGMHKIEERPVALGGQVVIRPMMYLALSYDHRLIDGREAVTFLVRVKELLEDPSRLLLDI
ncbi:MAG TPA: 2-oxoglutarate dehydrogenase complex dihydrolipoyllysine-residue succinyltransferase [Sphingomonadales bacterium]|nr:2-oxoglutarate dehydrogenase complex dihydrolipoyllysine-residue succinyltransferase [Sphingomonadales bacterium]